MKKAVLLILVILLASSCNSNKDYSAIKKENQKLKKELEFTKNENKLLKTKKEKIQKKEKKKVEKYQPKQFNNFYVVFSDDKLMIFEELPIEKKINLIDLENKNITSTTTKQNIIYVDDVMGGEYNVTTTTIKKAKYNFNLAFMGNVNNYKWPKKEIIDNKEIIDSVLGSYDFLDFEYLFIDYESNFNYINTIKGKPEVELIRYNNEKLYLVTYKINIMGNYVDNGPKILLTNKYAYGLNGICTGDNQFFIINNKLYIYTSSGICHTGGVTTEVYEYDGKKVSTKMIDGSFAD